MSTALAFHRRLFSLSDFPLASLSFWGIAILSLALILLPVSERLLDAAFALNFALTFAVFAASVTTKNVLDIAAFPGMLLTTTWLRLGIALAATRSALTRGSSGAVVAAFAYLTGGNDVLVGCVIFIVMQIVQFLVISKGAERVAEVAARFALDALPGRQMSIDADLRAGVIDEREAKDKRVTLAAESRFFGSMDGAMKFIKGECAASLAIAVVNLAGGVLVGCLRFGMPLNASVNRFTALALGDVLAEQIPSLLVSLSAGFLVTRTGDLGSPTSAEITGQLFRHPATAISVAGLLAILAFIPGFPTAPLGFGAFLFSLGGILLKITNARKATIAASSLHRAVSHSCLISSNCPPPPLVIAFSVSDAATLLHDANWLEGFDGVYPTLRNELSLDTGVPFPQIDIRFSETVPGSSYQILIYGTAVTTVSFLPDTAPTDALMKQIATTLKNHAVAFIGIQEVRDILARWETTHPELVREVMPRAMGLAKLTDIVRRLVAEGVPIANFRLILETLANANASSKNPVELTEEVRTAASSCLMERFVGHNGRIHALLVDPRIESTIEAGIRKNGEENYLALATGILDQIVSAARSALDRHHAERKRPIILTRPEIRRYLRKVLESEFPDTAVLSFAELKPDVIIEPIDTITLEETP